MKLLNSNYVTSGKFGKYRNDFKKISNELHQSEMRLMEKSAKMVRDKIKEKIVSQKIEKRSGDLLKGIKAKRLSNSFLVGAMSPAWHAHLLEFGTVVRKVFNHQGRKGVAVSVGRVAPRPFIFPTFEEQRENVRQILSEPWIE